MAKSAKKTTGGRKKAVSTGVTVKIETSALHTALRVFIDQVARLKASGTNLPTKVTGVADLAAELEEELDCQVSMYPSAFEFEI